MNKKEFITYTSPKCVSYIVSADYVCAASPISLIGTHTGEEWDGEE